jgi:hypothetical protein
MNVPSRELTPEDPELIEFARQIMDANTDRDDGVPRSQIRQRSAAGGTVRRHPHGQNTRLARGLSGSRQQIATAPNGGYLRGRAKAVVALGDGLPVSLRP